MDFPTQRIHKIQYPTNKNDFTVVYKIVGAVPITDYKKNN